MPIHPGDLYQRLRHWQGQALRSRDLNDQGAYDALMHAWHNRALHSAYGISEGLQVRLDTAGGAVQVSPGLAYDACGTPLVLVCPACLPLPEQIPDRGLVLLLCSEADVGRGSRTDLTGACLPGPAPRSTPVRLSWAPTHSFDPRPTGSYSASCVALALLLPGPKLGTDWNQAQSRPLARPRVVNGATLPGSTGWRLWELDRKGLGSTPQWEGSEAIDDELGVEEGGEHEIELRILVPGKPEPTSQPKPKISVLGLQVDVDTSAAGFTAIPCYMAWLEGDVWQPDLIDRFAQDRDSLVPARERSASRLLSSLVLLELLGMRFGHVYRPTATGFTYRLWFPQIAKWIHTDALLAYLLLLAQEGRLAVAWVGIQGSGPCRIDGTDEPRNDTVGRW